VAGDAASSGECKLPGIGTSSSINRCQQRHHTYPQQPWKNSQQQGHDGNDWPSLGQKAIDKEAEEAIKE